MKRKILIITIVCLLLTACKAYDEVDETLYNVKKDNLYTDKTKLVYKHYDSYYIVFNYDENKITGMSYYYDYEDSSTAKMGIDVVKDIYKDADNIENIYQEKKYVIVKFSEENYKELTYDDIRNKYSNLELVKE